MRVDSLLVVDVRLSFIASVDRIAIVLVILSDLLRDLLVRVVQEVDLLLPPLVSFVLLWKVFSGVDVSPCLAFPDITMEKRVYSVIREILVKTVGYLELLAIVFVREVYCDDVSYVRMNHLHVFPYFCKIMEED